MKLKFLTLKITVINLLQVLIIHQVAVMDKLKIAIVHQALVTLQIVAMGKLKSLYKITIIHTIRQRLVHHLYKRF